MSNVVDIAAEVARARHLRNLYRLVEMDEAWRREVEADPWPFIDKAMAMLNERDQLLDRLDRVLNPLPVYVDDRSPVEYVDPLHEDHRRAEAARRLLSDWRLDR